MVEPEIIYTEIMYRSIYDLWWNNQLNQDMYDIQNAMAEHLEKSQPRVARLLTNAHVLYCRECERIIIKYNLTCPLRVQCRVPRLSVNYFNNTVYFILPINPLVSL